MQCKRTRPIWYRISEIAYRLPQGINGSREATSDVHTRRGLGGVSNEALCHFRHNKRQAVSETRH